jgi:hypothetical protein
MREELVIKEGQPVAQHQTRSPNVLSFAEVMGFYAYLFAVGGGVLDRNLLAGVVRRPQLIAEIARPVELAPDDEQANEPSRR